MKCQEASKSVNPTAEGEGKTAEKIFLSVLELAAPVWNPGLTEREISQLERVQKIACGIILGGKINSYISALKILNMETLESQREEIHLKFAKRALKSEKFKPRAYNKNPKTKPVTYRRQR